ncbi:NRDE protein-domain-containing protein [Dichotomopilus funicola]|uniref:NRDE protein-domain-containing protein n=1 Tax=Dichotomopilus funicola TaxID=1934379 RepID=A0AAN6V8P1_9PEZI|nr:NRDE protein-domain-containing protein [Dichotomopilus funicola]
MCIVLMTTAHPDYALVAIDNRDEYILRPTSRPHWWTARPEVESRVPNGGTTNGTNGKGSTNGNGSTNGLGKGSPAGEVEILSSRDLQRAARGTWLGITKDGNFAILTNYREAITDVAAHPVCGVRSRGSMVTAWLRADPAETTEHFVHRMLAGNGVKGVGGFSLICGKLRKAQEEKNIDPLSIISNRCDHAGQVPWICGQRGSVYGLSNAIYVDQNGGFDEEESSLWPKVQKGKTLLSQTVADAVASSCSETEFIASLFKVLDTDDFPLDHSTDVEQAVRSLRNSIFIPPLGGKERQQEMEKARQHGRDNHNHPPSAETTEAVARPDEVNGFESGLYGTQRQTVILVDWDGNVTFIERALWDSHGNAIPKGEGDEIFKFKVEGWEARVE